MFFIIIDDQTVNSQYDNINNDAVDIDIPDSNTIPDSNDDFVDVNAANSDGVSNSDSNDNLNDNFDQGDQSFSNQQQDDNSK